MTLFSRGGECGGSTNTLGGFVGFGLRGGGFMMREERFEPIPLLMKLGVDIWVGGCGLGMSRLSRGFTGPFC